MEYVNDKRAAIYGTAVGVNQKADDAAFPDDCEDNGYDGEQAGSERTAEKRKDPRIVRKFTRRYGVRSDLQGTVKGERKPFEHRKQPNDRMRSLVTPPTLGPDMRAARASAEHTSRMNALNSRRDEERKKTKELWSRNGIREDLMYGILAAIIIVFLLSFVPDRWQIIELNMQNQQMASQIRETRAANDQLRSDISEKESGIFVGYEAAEIGLVADTGVEVTELTVPDNAIMAPPLSVINAMK